MKPLTFRGAAIALTFILTTSAAAVARQPVTPSGIAWMDGQLTQEQANSLSYLAYPQTYEDMLGTYGAPAYRGRAADYYQVGNQWIAIAYDANNQATGFDFWK